MSHPSQRNKLSDSVIISFVCCLLFAQSTRLRDKQTDIDVTIGRSNICCQRIAIGRMTASRDLLRADADWLDYGQLGHEWQRISRHV
jgi:hypothetical protein